MTTDPGLWTDQYHPDAAYIAWHAGHNPVCTFDVFVRTVPFGGAYLVAVGVDAALRFIRDFHYGTTARDLLRGMGYPAAFLDELARLRFSGSVLAVPEGRLVFPGTPILRVTAPFREAVLMESGILQAFNTATLVATKAARVVQAAAGRPVAEFGFRRAQAPLVAAYAARIGGCASTSLLAAAAEYAIPASGTIPHALVQLFPSEEDAFRAVAAAHPRFRLLLDTYDTVRGAELAAAVGRWAHDVLGHELVAVRLDSGDLDALSRRVRAILDAAGLTATQILASGDLDEWQIARLVARGAPIDAFGVGTALVNGLGEVAEGVEGGALGGVYKLAWVEREDGQSQHPAIKTAVGKTTWPGRKRVARAPDFSEDLVLLDDEPLPDGYTAVLQPALDGTTLRDPFASDDIDAARTRAAADLAALPSAYRALHPAAPYPVRYSAALQALRHEAEAHTVP
jgi:nicotinate phosphoribosyltransferase